MAVGRRFFAGILTCLGSLISLGGHAAPRLQYYPEVQSGGKRGTALAAQHAAALLSELNGKGQGVELRPAQVQKSLLGKHYHFNQFVKGLPVQFGEVIISILNDEETVFLNYVNLPTEGGNQDSQSPLISMEEAYDRAWQRIGVTGDLSAKPSADLIYYEHKDRLHLSYKVTLEVDQPYGAYEAYVDAHSAAVLEVKNGRLERRQVTASSDSLLPSAKALSDRKKAFARFSSTHSSTDKTLDAGERRDGTGSVFDPDPRTTLQDASLDDNSPAEAFEGAYQTKTLKDLAFDGTTYSLNGPWISIKEFDSPISAPSTTTTGVWDAKRGNNAFNDAMTYFHIDQNQRYLQQLGFRGERGIQFGPIEADTNGVNGSDNSYFQPGSNRLSFGHGCVDDNEDSDVILHEYGHAIHHSINRNWSGADTGAMGEGFGDYWAASYSLQTPKGPEFFPTQVFNWDGHGAAGSCWPGRVLDALSTRYNPSQTYGAHSPLPGGFQTDELWSTPIYQARVELARMGVAGTEVDRIIIESHFGLGSGIKMRDMATQIVKTAGLLYANGPHKMVFVNKFAHHNILDVPSAKLQLEAPLVSNAGANGRADPGETVSLIVPVINNGTLTATAVAATLQSTTPGVTVGRSVVQYPDVGISQGSRGNEAFELGIARNVTCGTELALSVKLSYNDGMDRTVELPFQVATGTPVREQAAATPNLTIPDNNVTGVTSTVKISATTAVVSESLKIHLNLSHAYVGDLKVTLVSPSGKKVLLHNRSGGSADNLLGIYPSTLAPAEPLSGLVGEPLAGEWQLVLQDLAASDEGKLISWEIEDTSRYECEH